MLKLKVEDMSCGHCAATVRKAVTSIDPTAIVNADLTTGIVSVETTADDARIGDAIRSVGYQNRTLLA